MVATNFDPNGPSSGYHSVTLRKERYKIALATVRSHFYNEIILIYEISNMENTRHNLMNDSLMMSR